MSTTDAGPTTDAAALTGRPHRFHGTRRRARGAAAGVAVLLALAAAGCGGDDEEPTAATTAGGTEEAGTETTPTVTTGASTAPEQAPPQEEEVIASRESTVGSEPVSLEILSLRRSDAVVNLTFRLRLVGADTATSNRRAQVSGTFANDVYEKAEDGTSTGGHTLDGISLIDTKNRKRHLVARDSTGHCVCDVNLSSAFVRVDAPLTLSATFGAPPDDVSAMDVVVPKFGTFSDVPLS